MTIHQHIHPFLHKRVSNFSFFQRQKAPFAGCICHLYYFFDEIFRRVDFKHKRLAGDFTCTKKLAKRELRHNNEKTTAKYDQYRGNVDKHAEIPTEDHGHYNKANAA